MRLLFVLHKSAPAAEMQRGFFCALGRKTKQTLFSTKSIAFSGMIFKKKIEGNNGNTPLKMAIVHNYQTGCIKYIEHIYKKT